MIKNFLQGLLQKNKEDNKVEFGEEKAYFPESDLEKSCEKNSDSYADGNTDEFDEFDDMFFEEGEFADEFLDPYEGLSDTDIAELSEYEELGNLSYNPNALLVKYFDDGKRYVKKYLYEYDIDVYRHLYEYSVPNMPKIYKLYEGTNALIIIEEYIEGSTLLQIISGRGKALNQGTSINIALDVCKILSELHSLENPIVHGGVKPSNIMLAANGNMYLMDVNYIKIPDFTSDSSFVDEDTIANEMSIEKDEMIEGETEYKNEEECKTDKIMKTPKMDIYSVGVLLNVMITGSIPKDVLVEGPVGEIIEKCISTNPDDRYSVYELISELQRVQVLLSVK